ncbi:MAG: class I SAM-dependent methyltransferase [Roseiflexaceae bacterium]|nr:class I SAM-dependent methyltransferase [Roseiflexaceae bacterium]
MPEKELRFTFGQNWQSFIEHAFTPQRLAHAARSLQQITGYEHLVGQTFLDIGCGSGLFSLAALMLGAQRVVSFDYDNDSVAASIQLRVRAGISAERWSITQGSVLDPVFMDTLAPAQIVYSWGVLHHTGAMWNAIDRAAEKVLPSGRLVLAIYNRVDRPANNSSNWQIIKRLYNQSSAPIRFVIEGAYATLLLSQTMLSGQNPLAYVSQYSTVSMRGMEFWHDVRDWVGGYPYEYASVEEVAIYLHQREFTPIQVRRSPGLGCNELTFQRS